MQNNRTELLKLLQEGLQAIAEQLLATQQNDFSELRQALLWQHKINGQTAAKLALDYLDLLVKWNQVHALTAIKDPTAMVIKHLLDSVAIAPFINGANVLDVGTGAGLPGIPIALTFPQHKITLLDASLKKVQFLTQCKLQLGLNNIEPVHARVEQFHTDVGYDCIVSRAMTNVPTLVDCTQHLCADDGMWVIMKGKLDEYAAREDKKQVKVVPLDVPKLDEARHIVMIENNAIGG